MPCEIRIYIRDKGKLEPGDNFPLESIGHCPLPGEIVCQGSQSTSFDFYEVKSRYLMMTGLGEGWALIVEPVAATPDHKAVLDGWLEDDEFWEQHDRERAAEEDARLAAMATYLKQMTETPASKRGANKVDEILSRERPKKAAFKIDPPLSHRERSVMKALSQFPDGEKHHWREIPGCGPDTQKRLLERGYIKLTRVKGIVEDVWLTSKGREDWSALERGK